MSLSFLASKLTILKNKTNVFEWIVDFDKVTISHFYDDLLEMEMVNPDYNPILDVNLSNGNAYALLSYLGYKVENGLFESVDIHVFRRQLVRWNSGDQSIHDPDENYYQDKYCVRLLEFCDACIALGATHIYGA